MRRLALRFTDAVLRPKIESYVFSQLLRMPQAEFLRGATHAAIVLCRAISEETRGNHMPLAQLFEDAALEPFLHSELRLKARSRQQRLESGRDSDIRLESDVELPGPGWLQHTRLIVGAARSTFDSSVTARLDFGSHVVVCGKRQGWKPPPLDLDLARRIGCTVQCTVVFQPNAPLSVGTPEGVFPHLPQNATPMQFTFETTVAAEEEDEGDVEAAVRIVDINGLARGAAAFWREADVVDPVRLLRSF